MSFNNSPSPGERPRSLLELDSHASLQCEHKPFPENEYDEMRTLLTSWGLPQYIQTFEENAVTASILAILSEEEINSLIPKVGHKALFRRNWQRWVQDMHLNLYKSFEQNSSFSTGNSLDLPSVLDLDTNTFVVDTSSSSPSLPPSASSSSNKALRSSSPAPSALLPIKNNNHLTIGASALRSAALAAGSTTPVTRSGSRQGLPPDQKLETCLATILQELRELRSCVDRIQARLDAGNVPPRTVPTAPRAQSSATVPRYNTYGLPIW